MKLVINILLSTASITPFHLVLTSSLFQVYMFVATKTDVFHGLAHIPNAKAAATDNRNHKPQPQTATELR